MGIMVYSLLWVVQDFVHQPYRIHLGVLDVALLRSKDRRRRTSKPNPQSPHWTLQSCVMMISINQCVYVCMMYTHKDKTYRHECTYAYRHNMNEKRSTTLNKPARLTIPKMVLHNSELAGSKEPSSPPKTTTFRICVLGLGWRFLALWAHVWWTAELEHGFRMFSAGIQYKSLSRSPNRNP